MGWVMANAIGAAANGYWVFGGQYPVAHLLVGFLNAFVCGVAFATDWRR